MGINLLIDKLFIIFCPFDSFFKLFYFLSSFHFLFCFNRYFPLFPIQDIDNNQKTNFLKRGFIYKPKFPHKPVSWDIGSWKQGGGVFIHFVHHFDQASQHSLNGVKLVILIGLTQEKS